MTRHATACGKPSLQSRRGGRTARRWVFAGLCLISSGAGAEAPYRSLADAREGSDLILQTLQESGAEAALALAVRESHQDDPRVQKNLSQMTARLPAHMASLGPLGEAEFTGLDRFMSAFGRYNYLVHGAEGDLRVMLTYRRKTDGWRLNQFYFD